VLYVDILLSPSKWTYLTCSYVCIFPLACLLLHTLDYRVFGERKTSESKYLNVLKIL